MNLPVKVKSFNATINNYTLKEERVRGRKGEELRWQGYIQVSINKLKNDHYITLCISCTKVLNVILFCTTKHLNEFGTFIAIFQLLLFLKVWVSRSLINMILQCGQQFTSEHSWPPFYRFRLSTRFVFVKVFIRSIQSSTSSTLNKDIICRCHLT